MFISYPVCVLGNPWVADDAAVLRQNFLFFRESSVKASELMGWGPIHNIKDNSLN